MAYSLKIDASKTNIYRDIETGVKKYFTQHGFNVISANYLSDANGNYITSATLRNHYRKLPGGSKQINHDDIALMADCLMSADFFLDCGSFVSIVDVTCSKTSPVSLHKLTRKQSLMKLRLGKAMQTGLSIKIYCPHTKRYVIKPISKGLIIALDYLESLNLDALFDALDHQHRVRFVRFFNNY